MDLDLKYILGIDVGVTSLGWSVIELGFSKDSNFPSRLIDAGVRVWNSPESPKNGESLNTKRREARSSRRRLNSRKQRLKDLKLLLKERGLLDDLSKLSDPHNNIWELRAKALDTLISNIDLARIVLHISKHRGFKSNRKSDLEKEGGDFKPLLEHIAKERHLKGYRTFGEQLFKDPEFNRKKRNTSDKYIALALRKDLEYELELILKTQKKLGNKLIDEEFIKKTLGIFARQKPFMTPDLLKKMVGKCTFFKDQDRLARNTYTAEKFILLSKINNLRIKEKGEYDYQDLSKEQKDSVYKLAFSKTDIKYSDIRKVLNLPFSVTFNINYYVKLSKEDYDKLNKLEAKDATEYKIKHAESKTRFIKLDGYHTLRLALEKSNPKLWGKILDNESLFNNVIEVLVFNKDNESIINELNSVLKNEDSTTIESLCEITNFKQFINLSEKALKLIIPELETGLTYDKAVEKVIPSELRVSSGVTGKYLPSIPIEEIRNPVVNRALCQSRIVINSIIKEYGSPSFVHIELARDLAKNFSDRKKIEREQQENQSRTESIINELKNTFEVKDPKGIDILKFKLWKSQDCKCMYSMKPISAELLFSDDNYTQVDHILPFSRSLNDNLNNKVLVLTSENQNKRDRTPYEFIGKGERWDKLNTWWLSLYNKANEYSISKTKLDFLTNTSFKGQDLQEFISRDLNDTRYIARFLKNFIENNLLFSDIPLKEKRQRVFTFSGRFTSILRRYWGFNKNRDENLRHHALDAVILGVATKSMLEKVSTFFKSKENYEDIVNNTKKHFPVPWEKFVKDIETRIYSDNVLEDLKKEGLTDHYGDRLKYVRPIFVSRKADRKITGELHEATIRAIRKVGEDGKLFYVSKTSIKNLKKEHFDENKIFGNDKATIEALKSRLEIHDWNAEAAFKEPVYKRSKNPKIRNEIKTIKLIVGPANSYVKIREKTYAENASMIRVDIFKKNEKFYIVPIYINQINGALPNRAIVARKDESEWEIMDNDAEFKFSLYPNEFIRIKRKGSTTIEGFYIKTDRSNGALTIETHDLGQIQDRKFSANYGITTAKDVEKIHISSIGKKHLVKKEKRHGFQIHPRN